MVDVISSSRAGRALCAAGAAGARTWRAAHPRTRRRKEKGASTVAAVMTGRRWLMIVPEITSVLPECGRHHSVIPRARTAPATAVDARQPTPGLHHLQLRTCKLSWRVHPVLDAVSRNTQVFPRTCFLESRRVYDSQRAECTSGRGRLHPERGSSNSEPR